MKSLLIFLLAFSTVFLRGQTSPTVRFDTIGQMVAYTIPGVNNKLSAIVSGGTSATGDSFLAGEFAYSAASTVATNKYSVFKPLGTTGRWIRITGAHWLQTPSITIPADDESYSFQLQRGLGTNILTLGATGTNAIIQSFNSVPLFINPVGANNVIFNELGGQVGIGVTTPTAGLHLRAGSAAANSSPLKLTAGPFLTAPEAGAIEFDGSNLFYTTGAGTRITVASSANIGDWTFGVGTQTGPGAGSILTVGALTLGTSAGNANVILSPNGTGITTTAKGLSITSTTAATSSTTGSLINAGGFGNNGKGYFGDNLFVTGTSADRAFEVITTTSGQSVIKATGFNASTDILAGAGGGIIQLRNLTSAANVYSSIAGLDATGANTYAKIAFVSIDDANNEGRMAFMTRASGLSLAEVGSWESNGKFKVLSTTASTSSTTGAATFGNGTASTTVGVGGGSIGLGAKVNTYAAVTTAGWGVPAIYGSGSVTGNTSANASVATYTCGAADGSFQINCQVLVTTSSAEAFTVECAYTDTGNTARVMTLPLVLPTGVAVQSVAFANGAIPYAGNLVNIRVKASTAITLRTQAAGTYTGCTYNVGGSIIQIQ